MKFQEILTNHPYFNMTYESILTLLKTKSFKLKYLGNEILGMVHKPDVNGFILEHSDVFQLILYPEIFNIDKIDRDATKIWRSYTSNVYEERKSLRQICNAPIESNISLNKFNKEKSIAESVFRAAKILQKSNNIYSNGYRIIELEKDEKYHASYFDSHLGEVDLSNYSIILAFTYYDQKSRQHIYITDWLGYDYAKIAIAKEDLHSEATSYYKECNDIKEFVIKMSKIFKNEKYKVSYNKFPIQGLGLITDGVAEYMVVEVNNGFFKSKDLNELKKSFNITEQVEININTLFGDI